MIMMQRGTEVNGRPFSVQKADEVYPELVKAVMPTWSLGFFAAVLLGSILSTFNSALNSASTLFGLEIYKIYINPEASEERVVKVASWFGASLTIVSWIIAPQLQEIKSIFDFLQRVKTLASLPIITIFIVGIYTVRPDAFSAKFAFVLGAVIYGAGQFIPDDINYLDVFFACFILALASVAIATYVPVLRRCFRQAASPLAFEPKPHPAVDMTAWAWLYYIIAVIVALVVVLTISLQVGSMGLFVAFWVAWILAMSFLIALPTGDGKPETGKESDAEASRVQEETACRSGAEEVPNAMPEAASSAEESMTGPEAKQPAAPSSMDEISI